MKKIIAGVSIVALGVLGLVGCGGKAESQHDKCKSAAAKVFNQITNARNLGDILDLSSKYQGDRLRDSLPECKPLTNAEDDEIQKELKPEIDKATQHANDLLLRDGLSVSVDEGN